MKEDKKAKSKKKVKVVIKEKKTKTIKTEKTEKIKSKKMPIKKRGGAAGNKEKSIGRIRKRRVEGPKTMTVNQIIDELRKKIKDKTIIIGGKRTLKLISKGSTSSKTTKPEKVKINTILISNDCEPSIKKQILNSKLNVIETKLDKQDLALVVKKPFNVSVVCVLD